MIRQGDIYLVDFKKKYNSELGKIRPAVVMQNNFLNRTIEKKTYQQVLVVPLSSVAIEDDFRMKIQSRDRLERDSFIIANWICTLDFDNVLVNKGLITQLTDNEFTQLKEKICNLM